MCVLEYFISSKYPQKRKILFFVNHDNFPQDSNMIVTITQKTLVDIVEDFGFIPPNLHIRGVIKYKCLKNDGFLKYKSL